MLNSLEFIKRIKIIMEYHNETSSRFAEKIGVQRSSISHLLSGRNKPSLDFVMKVVHTYPEVDLYWLLNGDGIFPKTATDVPHKNVITNFEQQLNSRNNQNPPINHSENSKKKSISKIDIDHIVIFYKDGSFKMYQS